jgi:GT2 family glycosyltransferase/Flp pilus assembly protein TadD
MSLSNSSSPKDISIIIPVHNRRELTEACLESIANSTNRATYEVIVVDNGSTDGTNELLGSIEGDFTLVTNKLNEGFASACNRGARIANGRHLLFLNNDTEISDGCLDVLLACANSHPEAGAIGAKLVYPNGKTQHAGIAFDEEGTPFHIFQNFAADHAAVCKSREMTAVTAACMLIEKSKFESVFGFDASYRNGFEDVDLCLKLSQKGLRSYYCAECNVVHHEEATEGRKAHDAENMILFATRWTGIVEQDDAKYLKEFGYSIQQRNGSWVYVETDTTANAATSDDPQLMLDLAQKKYLEGKHEEAATLLNSIVRKRLTLGSDDEFETWQLLGNCMARLNRAEEAEEAYLHAAETDSHSERPFLGLGSVAMLQENWTAAQYGFLAALSRNPETTRGEFGLGISLAARGRHDESLKHFKRVVEREPRNSEAVFYLYRSCMEANKPQDAIAALSKYLENNPEDVDFWFHLSGAQWKSGSLDDAISTCRRVLDINPEHAGALSALRFMEERVTAAV